MTFTEGAYHGNPRDESWQNANGQLIALAIDDHDCIKITYQALAPMLRALGYEPTPAQRSQALAE